jgi:hypothetical protein
MKSIKDRMRQEGLTASIDHGPSTAQKIQKQRSRCFEEVANLLESRRQSTTPAVGRSQSTFYATVSCD